MNISLQDACKYLAIGETVFNQKVAAGELPPKVYLAGTRRIGFDCVLIENARLKMHGLPPMTTDQAIFFRAAAVSVTAFLHGNPTGTALRDVPPAAAQPMRAVNSVFGLGAHPTAHRYKNT